MEATAGCGAGGAPLLPPLLWAFFLRQRAGLPRVFGHHTFSPLPALPRNVGIIGDASTQLPLVFINPLPALSCPAALQLPAPQCGHHRLCTHTADRRAAAR